MSQVRDSFIARQPILDERHRIVGYELFFRPGADAAGARVEDAGQATASVIMDTFATSGADSILGTTLGFINATPELLMSEAIEALPPRRVVLELPFIDVVDRHFTARWRELAKRGYRLAVQDLVRRDPRLPLLKEASYAKIDVHSLGKVPLRQLVRSARGSSVKVIAEKVETLEDLAMAKDAGFELFQGYYFAKPVIVSTKRIDPTRLGLMDLIMKLGEDSDLAEIVEHIKRDPGLSLNLLRLVNTGELARANRIDSVSEALALIGRRHLAQWLTLLLYAASDDASASGPLLQTASKRGKILELLVKELYPTDADPDVAYLVGMLSLLDVLFGVPMEKILADVNLSEEVHETLLNRTGTLGRLLRIEELLEKSDFNEAGALLAEEEGLGLDLYSRVQDEAYRWIHKD